jgi:hypothetical protein
MSILSKYVFNPLFNAIARSQTSVNVSQQSDGAAAAAVVSPVASPDGTNADTAHLSPMGQANASIGALETALNDAVAAYAQAFVTAEVPLVGGLVAPEVGNAVRTALSFGENHALNYLAGLFHFHAATAAPATA